MGPYGAVTADNEDGPREKRFSRGAFRDSHCLAYQLNCSGRVLHAVGTRQFFLRDVTGPRTDTYTNQSHNPINNS